MHSLSVGTGAMNHYSVIILFSAAALFKPEVAALDFSCDDGELLHPHLDKCNRFYLCQNGKVYIDTCPKGQRFDAPSRRCVESSKAICAKRPTTEAPTTISTFRCTVENGIQFHDELCERYFECHNWLPYDRTCPPGQLFEQRQKQCLPETKVDCGNRIRPEGASSLMPMTTEESLSSTAEPIFTDTTGIPFKCTEEFSRHPYIENCNKYYLCQNGKLYIDTCPGGQRFDAPSLTCVQSSAAICAERPTTEAPTTISSFRCTVMNGILFHDELCERYFECYNWLPYDRICPPGQLFEQHQKQCLQESKVDCGNRIRPEGASSFEPSEKPTTPISTTAEPQFRCWKENTFYVHELCEMYFECINWIPYPRRCPEGTLFDEFQMQCQPEVRTECGHRKRPDGASSLMPMTTEESLSTTPELIFTELSTTEAPTTPFIFRCRSKQGIFLHDQLCERYFECHNFLPYDRTCPPGQLFDQHQNQCLQETKVECGNRIRPDGASSMEPSEKPTTPVSTTTEPQFRCWKQNALYIHERCEMYYECYDWIPYPRRCPEGMLFDEVLLQCQLETRTDCGNRKRPDGASSLEPTEEPTTPVSTTTEPKFRCWNQNAFYIHERCEMYYECYDWIPYPRRCPEGMLFDEFLLQCQLETRTDCGNRKRPDGASSFEPTEETTTPVSTTSEPQFRCWKQNTFYIHERCEMYYECNDWIPYPRRCPEGMLFDEILLQCQLETRTDCGNRKRPDGASSFEPSEKPTTPVSTTSEPQFRCWAQDARYIHQQCERYYECIDWIPYPKMCPAGMLFDQFKMDCQPETKTECGNRMRPDGASSVEPSEKPTTPVPTTVEPQFRCWAQNARYLHEQCERYYECINWIPHEKRCPEGTLFHQIRMDCQPETRTECGNRRRPDGASSVEPSEEPTTPVPTTTESQFKCWKPNAIFPHELCDSYYLCDKWIPHLMKCPKGQLFDEYRLQCQPEIKTECGDRRRPDGASSVVPSEEPTTPVPTTTESQFKCWKPNVIFPHELCDSYYLCDKWIPHLMKCPEGQLFDEYRMQCLPEITTECGDRRRPDGASSIEPTGEPTTPISISTLPGFRCWKPDVHIMHELCEMYYECINWIPYPRRCPEGMLFDDYSHHCQPETKTNCGERRRPDGASSQEPDTTEQLTTEKLTTEEPTTEKPTTEKPTTQEQTTTQRTTTTPKPETTVDPEVAEFECPKRYGNFPYRKNKHQFIACNNSLPYLMDCPANLVFDAGKEVCVWDVGQEGRP